MLMADTCGISQPLLRGCAIALLLALALLKGDARASEAQSASKTAFDRLLDPQGSKACAKPVYLTLDTGNMASAELIAGILNKHQIKASFFLANERTPFGNYSLDDAWSDYWRQRVREGHAFGNHTFDHVYFPLQPVADRGLAGKLFKVRPQFGVHAAKTLQWTPEQLCGELDRVALRFLQMTGSSLKAWWRAPGGRAPGLVIESAKRCGYKHVHWAEAGFLGDELPSDRFSNASLVKRALENIRPGDILMAHLGIWSRQEVFAPSLDPLIDGLKRKGFCFRTLEDHPDY